MPKRFNASGSDVDAAIDRGLCFLEKQQETDGSFVSYSSARPVPFRRMRSWQTTFVPALMLAALAGVESARSRPLCERLAHFLLAQRSEHWSFNYWSKTAPEYRSLPYPDDLDDTFCALAALYLYEPAIIDGEVLAKAVKLLLATETAVGGPYRTWLAATNSPAVWRDVDMAVNSNVAYFLSLQGSTVPNLQTLMDEAITRNKFASPYYPLPYAFIYYFARAYQGPQKGRLLDIARQLQRSATTDLDRALCLTARLRLGDDAAGLAAAVRQLLAGQRPGGSWPAAAFYADPVKRGRLYYNGAAALTTALVLEALQLFKTTRPAAAPAGWAQSSSENILLKQVLTFAEIQCGPLDSELRHSMIRSLRTVAEGSNGREILGQGAALKNEFKTRQKIKHSSLWALGAANLYGWLAYTAYDDFLDGQGRTSLLPVANVAMRHSLDCFQQAMPGEQSFNDLVWLTFDVIDGANAWELANCRWQITDDKVHIINFPDYGDLSKLAERSLGHSLVPLALFIKHGIEPGSTDFKYFREAFAHYLISRQLNDDCHDWAEDLANGHASYAVVRLLQDLRIRPGKHDLPPLLSKARRVFWHTTLPKLCDEMQRHIRKSRQALQKVAALETDNILSRLLEGIEHSIQETLGQQARAEAFLEQYRNGTAENQP